METDEAAAGGEEEDEEEEEEEEEDDEEVPSDAALSAGSVALATCKAGRVRSVRSMVAKSRGSQICS